MSKKILVLEDELSIRGFIKIKLKNLGYKVVDVGLGRDAIKTVDDSFSIALLDIMLPDINGIEVCKILRKKYPNLGIIMLTAKGQENDKIFGLKSGADDYIVKPFSPSELAARIEALLRRVDNIVEKDILHSGPFTIDLERKILLKNDIGISLTPTEFSILHFLVKNSNKTLSRDDILNNIWGANYVGDIKIVDVNIRRLRQKIEDDPSRPTFLLTSWGYGYMWCYKNE